MTLQLISLIGTHFLVPFAFLIAAGNKPQNKIAGLSWMFLALVYIIYIYNTGVWDWFGYCFRYVWILALPLALRRAYRNFRQAPLRPERSLKAWSQAAFPFMLSLVFLFMAASSLFGRHYGGEAVELHFPLKNGTYYVAQGGNAPIINYHNSYPPQRFAVDIVKINAWGFRAKGFYPDDPQKYAIYGGRLYSPCRGIVLTAVDGFEDRAPSDFAKGLPEGTPAAGNHVVIACNGAEVHIAHMQKGSVRVREGDAVDENSWIGNAGNSGNTSEPHLHIHAERNGVGAPVTFGGRFPVRNSLIRSSR